MTPVYKNMVSYKLVIAVTTYNRWDLCQATLRSVANQDLKDYAIVLIDDASTQPKPEEFTKALLSLDFKEITNSTNQGLAASRNRALLSLRAKYFSFCDDDDQWPCGFASRLVFALDSAPADVGMAITLSEECKATCGHLFEDYPRLTELMEAGLTPPVSSQIYRTELLRQVGGYRPEVSSGVDHDLWISLARIDPRVTVAWGEPAIVGSCPSRERMTTVEHRRRAGIEKSLAIWRDDLCEVFGERFYRHFVDNYRWYLDYTFFIKSMHKREYLDTALRAVRKPWLPVEVIKRRWDRMRGRSRCTLFPEFKGD